MPLHSRSQGPPFSRRDGRVRLGSIGVTTGTGTFSGIRSRTFPQGFSRRAPLDRWGEASPSSPITPSRSGEDGPEGEGRRIEGHTPDAGEAEEGGPEGLGEGDMQTYKDLEQNWGALR